MTWELILDGYSESSYSATPRFAAARLPWFSRIGQALLEAKESGSDPYAAIEAVIPWDEFTESVSEAELLARPEGFDHLHLVGENFATLRRYTPALLEVLELRA
ncbi:hypothetical protein N5M28_004878, partial [Escherichia coli]